MQGIMQFLRKHVAHSIIQFFIYFLFLLQVQEIKNVSICAVYHRPCLFPAHQKTRSLRLQIRGKVPGNTHFFVISPTLVALHLWLLLMKEVAMDQSYSWAERGFTQVWFILAELLSKEGME